MSVYVPDHYDYVAAYLTDRCFLRCSYCITEHNDTKFISGKSTNRQLRADDWICGLNRLRLPEGVPVTLQGGEPFLFPGIWQIIKELKHDCDILTALPPKVRCDAFESLDSEVLKKLNRNAPYPNIRVSYHYGQNKLEDLVERVSELQKIVSIGIYMVDYPGSKVEVERAKKICQEAGVFFRTKEYLGYYQGKMYGNFKYPDAVRGKPTGQVVDCKNSVLIIGPNGATYRCHSDLYHKRSPVDNLVNPDFQVEDVYRRCEHYGLCSMCDVKIKTNHLEKFGYTSIQLRFPEKPKPPIEQFNDVTI